MSLVINLHNQSTYYPDCNVANSSFGKNKVCTCGGIGDSLAYKSYLNDMKHIVVSFRLQQKLQ